MKKITIKKATPRDVDTVFDITQEAFTKYASDLELPQTVAALKETKEDIIKDIKCKNVMIGYHKDQPVGTIRYQVHDEFAYISRFGVKLMAQGLGMGRALVQYVEDDCRKRGLKAILLHTSSRMFSLVRFYYGQDFFVHSTSNDKGYIRALMVRELNGEDCLDYASLV